MKMMNPLDNAKIYLDQQLSFLQKEDERIEKDKKQSEAKINQDKNDAEVMITKRQKEHEKKLKMEMEAHQKKMKDEKIKQIEEMRIYKERIDFEIQKRRDDLEVKERKWEEKEAKIQMMKNNDEIVAFDVSGTIFKLSRSTLESVPDSILLHMVNGSLEAKRSEENNAYFIQKDPEIFKYIISFYNWRSFEEFEELSKLKICRIKEYALYFNIIPLLLYFKIPINSNSNSNSRYSSLLKPRNSLNSNASEKSFLVYNTAYNTEGSKGRGHELGEKEKINQSFLSMIENPSKKDKQ